MVRRNRDEVAAYAADHTCAEVARRFDFAGSVEASSYLHYHKIAYQRVRADRHDYDWIAIARYAPSHTAAEVAAEFDVDVEIVRRGMRARNIPYLDGRKWRQQSGDGNRTARTAGDTGNAVYEWFLDHGSCKMCIDLGWERQCGRSRKDCETFLRGKLAPYFTGV